jgi:glycosyltransferase involved in cell wall biosynthesis
VRIAVDARELCGRPTGVGRYLAEIARVWRDLPEAAGHEIVWCGDRPFEQPFLDRPGWRTAVRAGHGPYWEQVAFPGLAKVALADVLFAPAYSGPVFGGTPLVVAIHDVSFAAHPEWFRWREGLRRRLLTRASARRAAAVLTLTAFSRDEIHTHLGIPLDRITIAPPGPSGLVVNRPAVTPQHTVLMAGSVFNRRHVPELMAGFGALVARHPMAALAVVGEDRTWPRQDLQASRIASGAADRIALHSYVDDDTLARLYGAARAFAYLSSYEGFGIPPLDALVHGVPPLLLDTPVAREVFGESAEYVARPEPGLIADGLERLLYDDARRSAILEAAPAVAARYSWSACARTVLATLERAGASGDAA